MYTIPHNRGVYTRHLSRAPRPYFAYAIKSFSYTDPLISDGLVATIKRQEVLFLFFFAQSGFLRRYENDS